MRLQGSQYFGPRISRKVYENALRIELQKQGLSVRQQEPISVTYNGQVVGEYYADLFGVKADPDVILNKVMLEDAAKIYFENLSGGQKQKVGLALALVNDPDVLFLDEPTTGLDPQARRNMWEVIRELKRESKTILLTTHYLEEAQLLADKVAIMNQGKVITSGTPEDIITEHGSGERMQVRGDAALADYLRKDTGLKVEYDGNRYARGYFHSTGWRSYRRGGDHKGG